jgi:hypothetical protein
MWQRADAPRRAAIEHKRSGLALTADDNALARFTFADLFAKPESRRRAIVRVRDVARHHGKIALGDV